MLKFLRIFFLLFLLISVVNCATKKAANSNAVISESTSKPTTDKNIEDFENLTFNYSLSSPEEKKWVDSIFSSLSTEEKIGQLFMVAAYSNKDSTHIKSLDKLIEEGKNPGETQVLVLGVTFKENVSDIRNSKIVDTVEELAEKIVELVRL